MQHNRPFLIKRPRIDEERHSGDTTNTQKQRLTRVHGIFSMHFISKSFTIKSFGCFETMASLFLTLMLSSSRSLIDGFFRVIISLY